MVEHIEDIIAQKRKELQIYNMLLDYMDGGIDLRKILIDRKADTQITMYALVSALNTMEV